MKPKGLLYRTGGVLMEAQKKRSKPEIANDLYLFAFGVKKQKFKEKYPDYTEKQIDDLTKAYFLHLDDDEKKNGNS